MFLYEIAPYRVFLQHGLDRISPFTHIKPLFCFLPHLPFSLLSVILAPYLFSRDVPFIY